MLQVIINTKRHSLVESVFKSACFLRKQILQILTLIYFQFNTPNKQMMMFFRIGLEKVLIW